MKLLLDPRTGMAGDMFTAALIAAGAPRTQSLEMMADTGKLLGDARVEAEMVQQGTITGVRLRCRYHPYHDTLSGRLADE
ncbi:MAG TPA: DUF111 family protein, partial [Spirochaetia bacterium]|nr:DUF111 family protein [Spirochaetia bacterium]